MELNKENMRKIRKLILFTALLIVVLVFCFYRFYKLVCSCPSVAVVPHENGVSGGVDRKSVV